jgi:hypothetical protein
MLSRRVLVLLAMVCCAPETAFCTLFTFDDAPLRSPLPVSVAADGITATLSATGQGFSIQEAGVLGFTPASFSGFCVYPSSVFLADLIIDFSAPIKDFSILYAPEEYACDSSCRMRATAFLDGVEVGTSTATTEAGTWPTGTLALSSAQSFNRVVVHYDAPPPTGGDYGPIFMADNMTVTPAPPTGGLRVPGDMNGDKGLDISDPVGLLSYLFLGSPPLLPCGDGSAALPANVSLLDWQEDGAIDISDAVSALTFLFLGGPAHALAIPGAETKGCATIGGCSDSCGP